MQEPQTHTTPFPPLMRVEEAARYRGVSRSRIFLMLKDGSLTRVRDGGRTLIDRRELDQQAADLIAAAQAA